MEPAQSRRDAAEYVQKHLGISERRACRALSQPRSRQRYCAKRPEKDRAITERVHELARQYPRYGYRRIAALLRQGGYAASETRVHRLWREAGLQVPQKKRKRRRLGTGEHGSLRLSATRANHVWSYDFLFDTSEKSRTLKILTIVDEYTRECLTLDVSTRITSKDVLARLGRALLGAWSALAHPQ